MPKLPVVSASDCIKAFKKKGFHIISQRGSHIKLQDKIGHIIIIPNYKEIKKGTLKKGILNSLGISVEEFIKLLKS